MAAPTVADVLTPLNSLLRQDPDEDNVLEWTEAQLLVYISDAAREAQRQLKDIDQNFGLTKSDPFDIVADQQVYTPDDIVGNDANLRILVGIERLDLGPKPVDVPVIRGGIEELRKIERAFAYVAGTRCLRYLLVGEDVWLAPVPTANVTAALRAIFEAKLVPQGGFTADADNLLFPDDWLEFIRLDAWRKALGQDDQNPGHAWNARQDCLKSLRNDWKNRNSGQQVETVQSVEDGYLGYGPWW